MTRIGAHFRDKFGANSSESMSQKPKPTDQNAGANGSDKPKRVDKYADTKVLQTGRAIPLDLLVCDPDQPRKEFDEEELQRLAASLKSRGQIQPARVHWDEAAGRWVIVAGERRFRAAILAGLPSLLCIEADRPLDEGELLVEQLTENCLREDLKPIERARAFKRLLDRMDWTHQQLADYIHISQPSISQAISLLSLPEAVQADVNSGAIAAGTAYEISKVQDRSEQEDLATLARAGRLKRSQIREIAQAKAKPYCVNYKVVKGQVTITLELGSGLEDVEAALAEAMRTLKLEKRQGGALEAYRRSFRDGRRESCVIARPRGV